ncbi:hypothetical protein PBCVNEJV1_526R [Paramecium bursaria Chlorella virus NE-JV-1]|nr:hypothetical protein PBCVNEJV1_526R [Paramecium bursaria Chlorella virus NE-JV-1]
MENNFNTLAHEFVKELSNVFPEEPVFMECVKNIDSYDPKKFLVDTIGDNQALAISKDEKLFDVVNVPGLDVKFLWSTLSNTSKESVWAYVSTLTMLATALDNTPKQLMSEIETLAQDFSEKMQAGTIDMNTLFQDVMSKVQTLDLSSVKDMDVASLTKSLGVDPAMISNMLGGMDPSVISNMMSMMSGAEDEDDLLKLLENAKPPSSLPPSIKTKKKKKSNKRKK